MEEAEHLLLAKILENNAGAPNGVAVWSTFNELRGMDKSVLALASTKLERLGYIEKGIDSDIDNEFYTFAITADGIDYLLENEDLINKKELNKKQLDSDNWDDDIPF